MVQNPAPRGCQTPPGPQSRRQRALYVETLIAHLDARTTIQFVARELACSRGLKRRQRHLTPSHRDVVDKDSPCNVSSSRCVFRKGRSRMLESILRAIIHSQIGTLLGDRKHVVGRIAAMQRKRSRETLHLLRWPALTRGRHPLRRLS